MTVTVQARPYEFALDPLGNDVSHLLVIDTGEGHGPDLSGLHAAKLRRGRFDTRIGEHGPIS
jgi:hypothetical protein